MPTVQVRTTFNGGFWVEMFHPKQEGWVVVQRSEHKVYDASWFIAPGKLAKVVCLERQTLEYIETLKGKGYPVTDFCSDNTVGGFRFKVGLPENVFELAKEAVCPR